MHCSSARFARIQKQMIVQHALSYVNIYVYYLKGATKRSPLPTHFLILKIARKILNFNCDEQCVRWVQLHFIIYMEPLHVKTINVIRIGVINSRWFSKNCFDLNVPPIRQSWCPCHLQNRNSPTYVYSWTSFSVIA